MDFDDFFQEEDYFEVEFKPEATAFERIGIGGKLAEMVGVSLTDLKKKLTFDTISSEDRFLIFVDAICRRMNSDKIATISNSDIDTMLEKTKFVIGLKYKNPVAYILGYLATEGGKTMKKEKVLHIINNVLPKMGDEGGVTSPDVIRYARYWKNNI